MFQIQRLHLSNIQLEQYRTPHSNFSPHTHFERHAPPCPNYSPSMQFHQQVHQQVSRPPLWRPQGTHPNIGEVRPRLELAPPQMSIPGTFERPPSMQTMPATSRYSTYPNPSRISVEHSYPWIQSEHPNVVRPIPIYASGVGPPTITKPPSVVEKSKSEEPPTPSPQQNVACNSSKPAKEKTPALILSTKHKKNSRIDEKINALFEKQFEKNKSPSQEEIREMCEKYNLTKGAVRTWFSARRQKRKKMEKEHAVSSLHKEQLRIPSDSYDITVEVPSINPRDMGSIVHQDYNN